MAKVALVTGGSRGIGAAACRLLARDGWDVAVNYRADAPAAEAVVADVTAAGRRAIAIQGDVGDEADVIRMFETAERALGPLTGLVNSAGVIGPKGRVDALTVEAVEALLRTNVIGSILTCREAVKRMSTKHGGQGGAIVNVSSGSAYIGNPGTGVLYAISKGAVNSLHIGLSQEVGGEGIRVNAVSPGMTATDMVTEEAIRRSMSAIPMGRVGEPEEIAEAIAWLMSDRASYVAGANIRVSGGRP
ncbi:glucose-1-dehydrogenase [Thalassobaculum fulvum]|uniref:Glucose-1-dehydrogenase n=1 Tax=Thalassobaculum fulvum TaxID=1633335 RepID=A0A919CR96_9PROT|nr:SDR family oxidoreductase [Thalassobaculum fulvum]GHD58096.1 glucose-1-dehydrogenase [Thalassobaculum fulvum]